MAKGLSNFGGKQAAPFGGKGKKGGGKGSKCPAGTRPMFGKCLKAKGK